MYSLLSCGQTSLQQFQAHETRGQVWCKEGLLLEEEDQDRKHLNKLDISPWDLMGCTHQC